MQFRKRILIFRQQRIWGRGKVFSSTPYIQGTEFRDSLTPLSEITAFSELGNSGVVDIQVTALDPTQALEALPANPQLPEVIEGCATGGEQLVASFFDLGRGGKPPSPEDVLTGDTLIVEWSSLDLIENSADSQSVPASPTATLSLLTSCGLEHRE